MKDKQLIETGLNINWFPGHMKKGTDELIKISKQIDLIIEVLDARAIYSSSNDEITKIFNNKPIIKIALKSDYSTISNVANSNILIGNIKNKKFKYSIINHIYSVLNNKIEHLKNKGLVQPKFTILVVGLPNVGKSSLINFLKNKNILIAQNTPGITKKQHLVAINDNFNMIDTPGILFKHISKIETAYKLVLINCIKKEILTLEHVLKFGFNHYKKYHYRDLLNYYKLTDVNDYYDFVEKVCKSKYWFLQNFELDLKRFETNIFNDFSLGKICKTNFDLEK